MRLGGVPIELARSLLRILGDVDEHGSRPAGPRDGERLAHARRHVGGARHEIVVLGDRQRDAGDVGFLKRVGSDQLAADLTGDADDRRAVHHRRRDAGDHVGRPRTRGGDGDADLAARARVAVGHVRRALLVADEHVANRILQHGVVRGQDRAAGIAEHVLDVQVRERLAEYFGASELHSVLACTASDLEPLAGTGGVVTAP